MPCRVEDINEMKLKLALNVPANDTEEAIYYLKIKIVPTLQSIVH